MVCSSLLAGTFFLLLSFGVGCPISGTGRIARILILIGVIAVWTCNDVRQLVTSIRGVLPVSVSLLLLGRRTRWDDDFQRRHLWCRWVWVLWTFVLVVGFVCRHCWSSFRASCWWGRGTVRFWAVCCRTAWTFTIGRCRTWGLVVFSWRCIATLFSTFRTLEIKQNSRYNVVFLNQLLLKVN